MSIGGIRGRIAPIGWIVLVGVFGAIGSTFGFAEERMPILEVVEHRVHGEHLVVGDGISLYLFTRDDQDGVSRCDGECVEAWPPVLVEDRIGFGRTVDLGLIGRIERSDGTHQVSYAGWPLYTFAQDQEVGDAVGHGVNDVWFLIGSDGERIAAVEDAQPAEPDPEVIRAGRRVYSAECSSCHGAEGGGGLGVRLVGNENLANAQEIASKIVHGAGYMPPFGRQLSNDQLASVLTFIRYSWGNEFGPVGPEEVEEVR